MVVEPIKIFYCYASQDRKLRDELEKQLMSLKRLGQITLHLNREILAGTNWRHVENRHFQAADLILLLISPDFIHSDYHYGIEMHHALEKHEAGNVWVIPIILRPTALWESTPIGKLQALPKDGKAITERRNRDAAFVDVVKGISEVVVILITRKRELAFATKAGEGEFPKFTRVIGSLCVTCGARNPLGVITCENCGDLLFTDAAKSPQEVHSPHPSSADIAEMAFFSNPAIPDLTDKSQSPTRVSEEEVFICSYCGTNYPPDEQFCSNCSAYLASSPADAPVVTNVNSGGASSTGSITLTPGARFENGRYVIKKVLGQGGMGVVYLVQDDRTGEHVALKIMLPKIAADERAKAQFLRETENTRALKHCHVVKLQDSGCVNGTFFIILEYCDGGSVMKLIEKRGGTLSIDEACPLILQALDGLQYAHTVEVPYIIQANGMIAPGRGLVHRDVKPANLFLASSGRTYIVKVGDYGLAKAFDLAGLSGQTHTGEAAGTPYFMPRQQVINFKYARPEVDVWAMAASLYYMLTGTFARDFSQGGDPCDTVLHTSTVPIRQKNAAIPKKLANVIDYALIDDPHISFKTAIEFKQALESAL